MPCTDMTTPRAFRVGSVLRLLYALRLSPLEFMKEPSTKVEGLTLCSEISSSQAIPPSSDDELAGNFFFPPSQQSMSLEPILGRINVLGEGN